MGFDIHLVCLRDGETSSFPRKVAQDIFDRGALEPSALQYVEYADGRGEIYAGDDDDISGFMIAHFSGETICARLLEIAFVTQSLLCWPSPDVAFGVTDLAHMSHLPEELRRDHYVATVRNVGELWSAINAELDPPAGRAV